MIKSLSVSGYRGLKDFKMDQLGRINLLVGKNNCGKTSVLEALLLLASSGSPWAIRRLLSQRGEQIEFDDISTHRSVRELELSHIFYGHKMEPGANITISSQNQPGKTLSLSIEETVLGPDLFEDGDNIYISDLVLSIEGTPKPPVDHISITARGGIANVPVRYMSRTPPPSRPSMVQYISTDSLSTTQLISYWSDISLTADEERVLTALRYLEPNIERLAATERGYSNKRGGFKVKLHNMDQPIPIGSLGEGIWRMFAMAMALVKAKDCILLVDEIDTGLHYSVLQDMWKLISKTSKEFNVQVFATTHSHDCVESLASICQADDANHDVTIQRIEAGKNKSVSFSEAEIKLAAERNVEVR